MAGRCFVQVYADDITLMTKFPERCNSSERKNITQKIIQKYLDVCTSWSDEWGLKFNPTKCEYVIIGAKRENTDLDIYLYGDKKIKKSQRIRVLGLIIENQKK